MTWQLTREMKIVALLVLTFGTFMQSACAAEDLITSQLADQARHWQQKGRDDFAAEIWSFLLRSEPNHGEALVKLGLIEARAGNRRNAQILFEQASRVRPRPRGLTELTAALATETTGRGDALLPSLKQVPRKTENRSKTDKLQTPGKTKIDSSTALDALILKP